MGAVGAVAPVALGQLALAGGGAAVGAVLAAAVTAVWAVRALGRWVEVALADASGIGPAELGYALPAFGWRDLLLTAQRAAHATAANVPLEAPVARDWLAEVRFDPATLSPPARPPGPPPALGARLGPLAARPLDLAFPLLLTGMGWGVGVSDDVQQALAEASNAAGVAMNAGEGPLLPVVPETAARWVWQWGRGSWQRPAAWPWPRMIELQVGQASEGGTAVRKRRRSLPRALRRDRLVRGALRVRAGLVRSLAGQVAKARALGRGVPVAVKLPASQHLEADLAQAVAAGVDVVVLDGAGAGTAGSPAVLADHLAIPTPIATRRARRWLDGEGLTGQVSLVVSGRVHGAADLAKLVALGADAVAVGTVALVAMAHGQASSPMPGHAPASLVLAKGRGRRRGLDRDRAAERLSDWLVATRDELSLLCQALGVDDVRRLGPAHLVADTAEAARALALAWYACPSKSRPAADDGVAALAGRVVVACRAVEGVLGRIARRLPRSGGAGTTAAHGG